MKTKLLLLLALILNIPIIAQTKLYIKDIRVTQPTTLQMPVMLDSVNLKGEKYELKGLLGTYMQTPPFSEFTRVLHVRDTSNIIVLDPCTDSNQFQFASFQLNSDKYAKLNIKISSPSMFELYVDGSKEISKTTTEDSLHLAKEVSKEITALPYEAKHIVIKCLTALGAKCENSLKISIEPNKKDSLAKLSANLSNERFTKVQDIMEGVRLTGSSISPNGQYILLRYRSVEKGGETSFFTELVDTKTSGKINLGTQNCTWMPKSDKYYYTVKRGNKLQLVAVDAKTMSEEVITEDIPKGGFRFSPNESYLLYTEKEENDDRKGDLKLLGSPEDRQDGYYNRYFIYKYDLSSKIKQQLTYGETTTSINDISGDSRHLLFSVSKETITERPFRKSSMYLLDLKTLSIDTLWKDQKFTYSAQFSPDKKEILVTGAPEAFDGIGLNIDEDQIANSYDVQAYIMNLSTKLITPITKNFDPSVNNVYWNKNDNLIYLRVVDTEYENIYSYNTKSGEYTLLALDEDVVSSISIASVSSKASYIGTSLNNSSKAYFVDLKSKKSTLISDPTLEIFKELKLGTIENWNFKASDGTTIEGRYYLPPNFDPSKKYPMIVYYYGGTTPTSRTFEHPYSMHNFASLGYVVYVVQPSGTIGYGQKFSARHVNAWGKRTADDIIEGTKQFIKEHSYINDKKIGCVGASYGGFMTMYLQTVTDIFAAAISHAGISSLSSYWGEGYWGYSYSSGASAHSYPWNNKELYIEQSPLFNADKINTPLLLLHGTVDTNVPMGESIQMYTALKILGKPVEFIQVKDENHGIAKYERKIQWTHSMYAWFDKWLKDEPQWWETMYPQKGKK